MDSEGYICNFEIAQLTQRLPFRNPMEFMALWAKSKKDMFSIRPAAKPWIKKQIDFIVGNKCDFKKLSFLNTCKSPSIFKFGALVRITKSAPINHVR